MRLLPDSPLGWTPYAWLVYLSIYVVYAVVRDSTPIDWIIDGAGLLVFLVLYFRGFWVRGPAKLWIVFALVGLGAGYLLRNPGASIFFIYAAGFLGDVGPPASGVRWLFVIVALLGLEAWWIQLLPESWVPGIIFSLIVGGTNIHFAEVQRKNDALLKARDAAEHLAAVAERERIARDLHDLLGHTLSVIVIKSELAAKLSERNPARAAEEIRDVERISRKALTEVRQAIHGYRGERFQDELANGRAALAAAGVTASVDIAPVALGTDEERALALALREAITNVIRHAHATTCQISLTRDASGVRLVVQDDGVGGAHVEGAGLAGMRARLAELGGTVHYEGSRGTRLTLVVS